jgi:hypothetical protein
MGSKIQEELKITTFYFLVYFRYLSGFILSRLGFFLGVFELNQIKGWADSLGPLVSQSGWA